VIITLVPCFQVPHRKPETEDDPNGDDDVEAGGRRRRGGGGADRRPVHP
jgi:hypothetical protein